MNPRLFIFLALVGCAVLGIAVNGGTANSTGGGTSSTDISSSEIRAASRTLRIQQCMGVVGRDVSLTEWARDLKDREARTGIDVVRQQTLAAMLAEQRFPGVTERCAAQS
jgi:hypothetical protein